MRSVARAALVGLLPLALQAPAAEPAGMVMEVLLPCRETFPQVVENPNAQGGWRLLEFAGGHLLCIYGSLPSETLEGLLEQVDAASALTIAVRSTGGPAESWLTLAEHLQGTAVDLVVDEACFSSCANYLPVIARSIRAAASSLLVWHGGPSDDPDEDTMLTMANLFEFIAYDGLSRRAQKLYAERGVSIELLRVSGLRTSENVMSELMEEVEPQVAALSVAGYAFSPDTLAECFGMTAARGMWHAGTDADLMRLSLRRSSGMIVLESPKTGDGKRICVAPRPASVGSGEDRQARPEDPG